jgi:crotonobetainyl-CoA:carnitine CoA-transferase CaiB-like acyl-CoA transferase
VIPEVSLGKRCARLDLRDTAARLQFTQLLASADVLVHGYRADALEGLGFGPEVRRKIRPGLIDVSLNAYGWSGPWRNRRGFDSLVQMSSGIAAAGMQLLHKDRPTPLPVQALDHVAGYVMAAAVIRGLTQRLRTGKGFEARTSLARTAQLLIDGEPGTHLDELQPAADGDYSPSQEMTGFGPALRLRSPLHVGSTTLHWDRPAAQLGSSPPAWT